MVYVIGSGSCPDCNVPLRRSNFRVQLFEDPVVEKEVDIRKRILRDFNKKEDDFKTLREYNDYLEEVETIIFNLTNNIDVIETNRRIDQFKKENKEVILKNKIKIGKDELELEEMLEEEKQSEEIRKRELFKEELEIKKKKAREKEALIDELMFSNADAKNIVNQFAMNSLAAKEEAIKQQQQQYSSAPARAATQFSTGIKFGRQKHSHYSLQKIEEGPLYAYKDPELPRDGPPFPSSQEVESKGYTTHMRIITPEERAGGYTAQIACMKALQEAIVGLFNVAPRRNS